MSPSVDQVISVADLARTLRRSVESATGRYWVDGEIAALKRAASGHVYFTLKDSREDAAVECVMYRMDAQRARLHLVAGGRVQIFGRATLWVPRGRLQVIVNHLRPVGLGGLLERLERLKAQLRAEGLFERERKRPLPASPRHVGVITSAHGAALHDIITVAFRRGRVVLVVVPALVQGEGAAESLLAAMAKMAMDRRIDVLIIGRGGGSSEDLMAFNDERVVRKLADFPVPTVSAVGHEVDTSLTDLVADVRAATPSQAAELVVVEWAARVADLRKQHLRLQRAMGARLAEDRGLLGTLRARVSDPRFVIAQRQQEVDELCLRAERILRRRLYAEKNGLRLLEGRLSARHPRTVLAHARASMQPLPARLRRAVDQRIARARAARAPLPRALQGALAQRVRGDKQRLGALYQQLQALSPLTVLARGYAIAQDEAGRALTDVAGLSPGQGVTVRLHRGVLHTELKSVTDETS